MIVDDAGVRWGTAAEIAEQLGQGVTVHAVRWWARNDDLPCVRTTDGNGRPQVLYPLLDAARIDREKRKRKRGRTRTT